MNLKDMRGRYVAIAQELETLTSKGDDWTDDDGTRARALLDEMGELEPKIKTAADAQRAAERARAQANEPVGQRAAGLVAQGEGAGEQREQRDRRGPAQRFIESDEFTRFRQHPVGTSGSVQVDSLLQRGAGPSEQRAVVGSATLAASALLADVLPTIYRANEADLNMRDVLLNLNTTSDTITVMQESGFTNNAAEVAEATSGSDGAKPESVLTFTEASFAVRTIAHWIPVTRQLLEDSTFMQGYIEARLFDGLDRRVDGQILNGNGTAPNLKGLLNTSGILTLDGTYFTANPVINAGQSVENFNRILRAKVRINLSTVGGAAASFVVVNPADYEKLLTVGDANRQFYGPGPFTGAGVANLWGLTVVQNEGIAAGTSLVGDGTRAAVADRNDARIYMTDSHSDYFVRNLLVILAEQRLALPVFTPSAFAKVTLV